MSKATLAALGASLGVAMVSVAYAGDGSVKPPDKDTKNAPADARSVKLAPADAAAVKLKPPEDKVTATGAAQLKAPAGSVQKKDEELKQKPAGK